MRFAPGLLAVAMLIARAVPVLADCGDDPGDAAALAATRADIEASCPCDAAASHRDYVRCAFDVIRTHIGNDTLRAECVKTARRCASQSTCGRDGAVTCCRVADSGRVRCAIKRDPSRCKAPRCVGTHASCCDACGPTGCNPPPTTTTTLPPCGGPDPFSCGGACPAGRTCDGISFEPPSCACVPDGTPCGYRFTPFCNGDCPPGEACGATQIFEGADCICLPIGTTACGDATYPTCGGVCPGNGVCQASRVATLTFCACVGATVQCSTACAPGVCPTGEVCTVSGQPCGCGAP